MNMTTQTQKLQLTVEKSDGELWGRVKVKGNLIVDSATTLEALKKKIKSLVLDFENIEVQDFEIKYDLTSFFESYPYIGIAQIASKSGINYGLMRQYATGTKYPSEDRVKKIEEAIHQIGKELTKVKLHKPQKQVA